MCPRYLCDNEAILKDMGKKVTWINLEPIIQAQQNQAQQNYRQFSNISRTLIGNKSVHHRDVVGASPVGAAPTTSSFSI